jgi:hypothetical protein
MTAKHLQSAGRRRAVARVCCVSVLAAALGGLGEPAFGQQSGQAPEQAQPITAVFKARDVDFIYRGSRNRIPCYELPGRVAAILRAVGARDDLQVKVTSCDRFATHDDLYGDPFDDGFGRDRLSDPTDRYRGRRHRENVAHVRINLMAPVEVTPKVMQEIERDKSRRELISRVRRDPTFAMNDPIIFAAQRQEVTLSRGTLRLEPEDCELLEQLSQTVFRKLGVRVVRGALNCQSGSRIPPQLTVEALLPVGAALPPAR